MCVPPPHSDSDLNVFVKDFSDFTRISEAIWIGERIDLILESVFLSCTLKLHWMQMRPRKLEFIQDFNFIFGIQSSKVWLWPLFKKVQLTFITSLTKMIKGAIKSRIFQIKFSFSEKATKMCTMSTPSIILVVNMHNS